MTPKRWLKENGFSVERHDGMFSEFEIEDAMERYSQHNYKEPDTLKKFLEELGSLYEGCNKFLECLQDDHYYSEKEKDSDFSEVRSLLKKIRSLASIHAQNLQLKTDKA